MLQLKPRFQKRRRAIMAIAVAGLLALVPATGALASATTLSFNFNTPNELSTYFDSYVASGTLEQSTSGGILDSGALHVSDSEGTEAVVTPKGYYTLGPVGSSYEFAAYMKSVGNSGYSGFGFTTLTPSSSNDSGSPFRPTDAIGVSVHGGGFVFHNGDTDTGGSWQGGGGGIETVTSASIFDLLNNGSPDSWYKVVFKVTRSASNAFDLHVEVWSANADGTLINASAADAIYDMNDQVNETLANATRIYSYINFSGYRVTHFDGFGVNLEGGAQVLGEVPGAESSEPTLPDTGSDSVATLALAGSALLLGALGTVLVIARRRRS